VYLSLRVSSQKSICSLKWSGSSGGDGAVVISKPAALFLVTNRLCHAVYWSVV
jgi:hypothetical protein